MYNSIVNINKSPTRDVAIASIKSYLNTFKKSNEKQLVTKYFVLATGLDIDPDKVINSFGGTSYKTSYLKNNEKKLRFLKRGIGKNNSDVNYQKIPILSEHEYSGRRLGCIVKSFFYKEDKIQNYIFLGNIYKKKEFNTFKEPSVCYSAGLLVKNIGTDSKNKETSIYEPYLLNEISRVNVPKKEMCTNICTIDISDKTQKDLKELRSIYKSLIDDGKIFDGLEYEDVDDDEDEEYNAYRKKEEEYFSSLKKDTEKCVLIENSVDGNHFYLEKNGEEMSTEEEIVETPVVTNSETNTEKPTVTEDVSGKDSIISKAIVESFNNFSDNLKVFSNHLKAISDNMKKNQEKHEETFENFEKILSENVSLVTKNVTKDVTKNVSKEFSDKVQPLEDSITEMDSTIGIMNKCIEKNIINGDNNEMSIEQIKQTERPPKSKFDEEDFSKSIY